MPAAQRRWPEHLVAWGAGGSGAHAHHAAHVVLAREGTLRARVGARTIEGAGIWVPSNVQHAIDAAGGQVVVLFLEPTSPSGAGVERALGREPAAIDAALRDRMLGEIVPAPATRHALATQILGALGVRETRLAIDARVRRVLRALDASELGREETTLGALAASVGMSPTRLTHLFSAQIGTPLRRYVLWLRVQRAVGAIVLGVGAAEAAHAAGFADAAHLSRAVRRTFGMPPSMIARAYAERA